MKRVFFLAMFLTILLIFFAACDSNDTPPVDTGKTETSAVVTTPVATEPPESTVQETDEPGTVPAETDSVVTEPIETDPVETKPVETDPVETKPVETDPVETETDHVHVWGDWQTTKEATCTENGLQERSCACGEKETQDIEAVGHTEVIDEAVAPTCTETGLTEGKHCSACETVLTAQETVAALGHTPGAGATCTTHQVCTVCGAKLASATGHSFGEWYTTKEPTEAEKGEKRRDCANCDEYETAPIAALAHSHDNWDTITLKAVAPTCTATGLTEGKKCSGCGELLVAQEVIPATGHSMSNWKQTQAPTCTVAGTEKRECSECDHSETRSVAATGHSHKAVVTAPTCTEKGYTTHTCHCGDSYVDTYVNALGHSFGEWYETKAPTCTAVGTEKHECSACNYKESRSVSATGHSYESVVIAPTCTEPGYTTYTCSCGYEYTEYEDALGHNLIHHAANEPTETEIGWDAYDTCSRCDYSTYVEKPALSVPDESEKYSEGLEFISNGDGTCYVSGIGTCTDVDIIIPELSSEGDIVVALGENAFAHQTHLLSVNIPATIKTYGKNALKGCTSLIELTIPEAYDYCIAILFGAAQYSNWGSFWIPDNEKYVPVSLETISVTGGTYVGAFAFYECLTVKSIVLPESIQRIDRNAFTSCKQLLSLVIPDSVTFIDMYAFDGCERLERIQLSVKLTDIGYGAFRNCYKLESIAIPAGVTQLKGERSSWNSEGIFISCESLKTIYLPASLQSIGSYVFYKCDSLTDVYYMGTAENWSDISIGTNNSCLFNATMHYESGISCEIHTPVIDQAIAPTCTDTGLSEGSHCGVCGAVITDQEIVEALGHTEGPEADCENHQICTVCHVVLMPKLDHHSNEDGMCIYCGMVIYDSYGLLYVSNGDGTCYVSGIGSCTATDLIIPPMSPDGDVVTAVGNSAFRDCIGLTSVTIPDSVLSIGENAFLECNGLTSISWGSGVTKIGKDAFCACTGLTSVVIPDHLTSVGNGAFARCTGLISVLIPSTWTTISQDLFNGCSSLQSVVIPNGITIIGGNAFLDCSSLTAVEIPDSVVDIQFGAFGRTALVTIDIPDSVKSMGDDVFNGCSYLTSVVIPEGVTSIGSHAFYYCDNLVSIVIPDSVTSIKYAAFLGCYSLRDVYYGATKNEWAKITISSYNTYFSNANIHFEETQMSC